MRLTGQKCECAYCGTSLSAPYEAWLGMVLDHVVPIKLCKSGHVPDDWCEDYSNRVLACAACNGFCNRYSPSFDIAPPAMLEAFFSLRDKIFVERKKLIAERHKEERQFFNGRSWQPVDSGQCDLMF